MKSDVVALRDRTKAYALRVIKMYSSLPRDAVARVIGHQALRSGTSVGAQYREACRSRSDAEMISKFESLIQELDETNYWLELLVDARIVPAKRLTPLLKETDELTAIFVASVKKVKTRRRNA